MIHRRHVLGSAALGLLASAPTLANTGQRWERRDGKATQVAIGSRGQVYVLGVESIRGGFPIFRRDGNSWTRVPGGLITLAVDNNGRLWGTNDDNRIFHHNGANWKEMPGRGQAIAVGGKGTVFVLGIAPPGSGQDHQGEVFEWSGSGWTKIQGARGTGLTVDHNDYPWVVGVGGDIRRHDGGGWRKVPGTVQSIAVGPEGSAWAIGGDNRGAAGSSISRWDGQRWQRIDGVAVQVAVGPRGLPWVVNGNGEIYERL